MRVVIDTNVVASAIFFGGKPKELIDHVMNDRMEAYASRDILDEYMDTVECLKVKFPQKAPNIPLMDIARKCNLVQVESKVDICRDPDDNKFIECALDSDCYYIVSGDKDLLTVGEYEGIHIMTVADFLKQYESFH